MLVFVMTQPGEIYLLRHSKEGTEVP